jgi:hypothetical protein
MYLHICKFVPSNPEPFNNSIIISLNAKSFPGRKHFRISKNNSSGISIARMIIEAIIRHEAGDVIELSLGFINQQLPVT